MLARAGRLPRTSRPAILISMEAPRVRYARSGDVSIAYGVVGDGPFDLVFVGGWVLSAFETAWDGPARDTLTALAQFSRLILFDKRGTGLSDRDAGLPDLETRMDDIRAVMDAVGSKRAAIIGVSEGGPITLLFAATYPERTAAAILYGTGASHTRADDYPWAATPAEWDRILAGPEVPAIGSDEWLDSRLQGLSPSIADDPEARAWWRKWVLMSASPSTVRALQRMNRDADVRHALPAITVPTLVLHPVGDPVWYLAEGRYIAERIPGAEMIELPGSDHGWWVRADELAGEAKRFLYEIWDRGEWDEVEHNRVLATVMFTDIVDSTEKLAELGDREWKALLQRHHALVRRQLVRYSGTRSIRPATGSSRASTARLAPSAARAPSRRPSMRWAFRYAPASTPASARWSTARSAGSPSISAPASPARPGRARCSSRARSRTSSRDPASSSSTAAPPRSRGCRTSGSCTRWHSPSACAEPLAGRLAWSAEGRRHRNQPAILTPYARCGDAIPRLAGTPGRRHTTDSETTVTEPLSTDAQSAADASAFSSFAGLQPARDPDPPSMRALSKVPEITVYFWIIKVLTTGMGESTSDYLVHRLPPPVAVVLAGIALVGAMVLQFRTPRYNVWAYWLAVVMVSVFGTMDADVLHIGLGIPYFISTTFFAVVLAMVFTAWYRSEHTLSIHSIVTRRRELSTGRP